MDNKDCSLFVPPSDQTAVLRGRQVAILAQIDALTRSEPNDMPLNSRTIAYLKQRYNAIVDKQAELARGPLADPLQTLPPELWPNIFGELVRDPSYPVDILLDLTSVSQAWSAALISLAELWTRIRLDNSKEDYIAKALMGIQFSRGRNIELHIGRLTLDEWRTISSVISPESGRLRCLSFASADLLHPPGELEILKDLLDLPVLQDLLYHRIPRPSADYLSGLGIKKMPSLKTILGVEFSEKSIWNQFITYHRLSVSTLQQEHINTLACLPRLKSLSISQFTAYQGEQGNGPGKSAPILKSVETFNSSGHNTLHSLKLIGDNLMNLSFTLATNTDLGVVLLAISRFPRLRSLKIRTTREFRMIAIEDPSPTVKFELPVKTVVLSNTAGEGDADHIVRALMPVSPWVESLTMSFITLTDLIVAYISTRKTPVSLRMIHCQIELAASPSLDMTTISYLRWYDYANNTKKAFTILQSLGARTLDFTSVGDTPQNEGGELVLEHFDLSSHTFPAVTSLIIRAESLAIWELGSFPTLRELEIVHKTDTPPRFNWGSDALDAILLRPRDTPVLEKITIKGDFHEWDILILMLERKNFLVEPGIAHIKTIVVDKELPYKLLYPLSELVGGKFVERDSNVSFSIEPIGQRLWDISSNGCSECCYSFRKCEARPTPFKYAPPGVSMLLARNHSLPSECMIADPPLPLEMARWLSGKRERREVFVRGYHEAVKTFYRDRRCLNSASRRGIFTITKDSLFGAIFEHSDASAVGDEADC